MNRFANWRAILPSWKFFDEIGPGFDMEYRFGSEADAMTPWCNARPPIHSQPWNLFFNPMQNLVHALDSLVERIVLETQALDQTRAIDFEASVTYGLVVNWARMCVKQRVKSAEEDLVFQFRICTRATPVELAAAVKKSNEKNPQSATLAVSSTSPLASEEVLLSLVHPL